MSLLDDVKTWVENGEAPGPQVVVDTKEGNGGRTRPLCLYPQWPRHNAGPVEAAASFACVK